MAFEGEAATIYIHKRSNLGSARSADSSQPISSAESVILSRDLRRLTKIISKAKEAEILSEKNENVPSASAKSSMDKHPAESPFNTPRSVAAHPQVRHQTGVAGRHATTTSSRRVSSAAPVSDLRPPRRHVSWAEDTDAYGVHAPHQTQQSSSSGNAFVEDLHEQLVQTVGPFVHAYLSLPPGVNPLLPHVSGGPPRPSTTPTPPLPRQPPPRPRPPPPPPPNRDEEGALGVHLTPRFLVYGEDLRTWATRVTAPGPEQLPAGDHVVL